MDYILQIEKLYKFFELNLEFEKMKKMIKLKNNFNNDLNLIGCFIKDFLTIENCPKVSDDENIYNDFVLCFEKHRENLKADDFIDKLFRYHKYYLEIAFEETDNRVLLNAIVMVNSCYYMECYPFLMELTDDYTDKRIDGNSYASMLQLLTDIVIRKYENIDSYDITLQNLRLELKKIILKNTTERLAV